MAFLTDPRYRALHASLIGAALIIHLATHYATYWPVTREVFGSLPYFRLHVLHEAEFLLIIAYAGVAFGWRGGLLALAATSVTSVPFILSPYVFGNEPRPNEIRDLAIQVSFILLMGFLIIALHQTDNRRRQLAATAEALREADRMKSNFISIASHELRAPLTVMRGFSELLAQPDVSEDKRRQWAAWIQGQTKRLDEMVEDLLNVSRIQSGKLQIKREAVDLLPLVSEAISVAVGDGRPHPIVVDIPRELIPVAADPDKLLQVMVNLVSNAAKYSGEGKTITVSAAHDMDRQRMVISIVDQGIGIAPEDQAGLFRTFHRISRPETENVSGNGLGLYIVKSFVELMGGTVWVSSELDRGSTFSFSVPVWQETAVPAIAGLPVNPPPQHSRIDG